MKQPITSLFFALLFALVVFSIGLSLHSMMRMAAQWPAPKPATVLRANLPKYTATPMPAAANRDIRRTPQASS